MKTARLFSDYGTALALCYEEEISGEAYFVRLAEFFTGRQRQALLFLADMERRTAASIRPLVDRHGLAVADPAKLRMSGQRDAERKSGTSWETLVTEMADEFAVFVEEFKHLERLAPVSDGDCIGMLTRHEVAALEFANREAAGLAESLGPLEEFLDSLVGRAGKTGAARTPQSA
jgi:dimethylamine/trimethylamine dehydrogenase